MVENNRINGKPVKFRIVLNDPALGWKSDIDNSNIAHAGFADQCIYIGHFFLKDLMSETEEARILRKIVLEDDEIKHINNTPEKELKKIHSGEEFTERKNKVAPRIELLNNVARVRKNAAWEWDAKLRKIHNKADAMFKNPSTINSDVVRELMEEYENYLSGIDMNQPYADDLKLEDNEVVCYDSMEYAPTHELPFFAGGLGALAGDHLRASSDLLPQGKFIAIGPHYRLGYLKQRISMNTNWQEEEKDPVRVVVEKFGDIVKDQNGEDIVISLPMPGGKTVYAKAWKLEVGRTIFYVLTSDIRENDENPDYKYYLDKTYASNEEKRLVQEYIVGVGGERLLERLGLESRVLHLNEGHVAFAVLEKARRLLKKKIELINQETGLLFDINNLSTMPQEMKDKYKLNLVDALKAVRGSVGFTSHTPVTAGNQTFQTYIAEKYLDAYLKTFSAGFSEINFAPIVEGNRFHMTEFALCFTNFFNGVARKHAEVCKGMYVESTKKAEAKLGYGYPEVTNVTNAVHRTYYQPIEMQELLEKKLDLLKQNGEVSPNITLDNLTESIARKIADSINDEEMEKVRKEMLENGIRELESIRSLDSKTGARILPLDDRGEEIRIKPDAFIMVYGRRMAMYKRPTFVLEKVGDVEVWRSIVRDARSKGREAQIIYMGKAHPDDNGGKEALQRILHIAKTDPELKGTIIFIEDYDTQVAKAVIKIATVALNNPEPPLEASGTSGMKFQLAGKPSVSVLDGWTLEALKGVFSFVTPKNLLKVLTGVWQFVNKSGKVIETKETKNIPTNVEEKIDGHVAYECLDPSCGEVWSVNFNEKPTHCPKCSRPAIKNNSYHELGIMDVYFNHKERWYEIMRESLVQSLSYFVSHRMFDEYMRKMYIPNIETSRKMEDEYINDFPEKSRGDIRTGLFTIRNSELRNKADISTENDFMSIRRLGRTTCFLEIEMLRELNIVVEGSKKGTWQLDEPFREMDEETFNRVLDVEYLGEARKLTQEEIQDAKLEIESILWMYYDEKAKVPTVKRQIMTEEEKMMDDINRLLFEKNFIDASNKVVLSLSLLNQEEQIDLLVAVANEVIRGYNAYDIEIEVAEKFAERVIEAVIEYVGEDEDSIQTSQNLQLIMGQMLTLIDAEHRLNEDLYGIRLTSNETFKMAKAIDKKRGPSFISFETLPEDVRTDENTENSPKYYYRGKETVAKLGSVFVEFVQKVQERFKARYNNAKNKIVLYCMNHGIISVPDGLVELTKNKTVSTYHITRFMAKILSGSVRTASTGPGHFQGKKMDIKQTQVRGIQFNVRYSPGTGKPDKIIATYAEAGDFIVSLPGYKDYFVSLDPDKPLVWDDFSVTLNDYYASQIDHIINFEEDENMKRLEELASKDGIAPYLGVNIDGVGSLVKNREDAPDIIWTGKLDFSEIGDSLEGIYKGLSDKNFGKVTMDIITAFRKSIAEGAIRKSVPVLTEMPDAEKITLEQLPSLRKTDGIHEYLDASSDTFTIFDETEEDTLIKVSETTIESIGSENINDFLNEIQGTVRGNIRIIAKDSSEEVSEEVYAKFGIIRKPLAKGFVETRTNTITLLPIVKGDELTSRELKSGTTMIAPGGIDKTIIAPVGINYNKTGLVTSMILGLDLVKLARNPKDEELVNEILSKYKAFSTSLGNKDFKLNSQDILALVTGNTNEMVRALNLLIKSLPIIPVNIEELAILHEKAREILIRA